MTKSTTKSTAKTKKRVASSVPQQALAKVSLTLTGLPDKPKESWSLRETVEQLQEAITIAMQRGYRYEEIVNVLASCGIHITPASLKRYLSIAKRANSSTKPRRIVRGQSSQGQSVQSQRNSNLLTAVPAPEPEPLIEMVSPRRRGQAASATKTAAKAKATPRTTASGKRTKK